MKPLISVIVPCYMQAQYLSEALNSVIGQSYENWEIIIVNDGSPDNTHEVANNYSNQNDKIKYLYKVNGGLSSARNAGLKKAKGEYIQFLDADDKIDTDKFLLQISQIENIEVDDLPILISDYSTFKSSDGTPGNWYLTPYFKRKNILNSLIIDWESDLSIPCHCVLVPMRTLKTYNIKFNECLPNHEDWNFWCKLTSYNKNCIYIDKKLAFYRLNDISMSKDSKKMVKGFLLAIDDLYKYFRNKKKYSIMFMLNIKKVLVIYSYYNSNFLSNYYRIKGRIKKSILG